MPIELWTRPTLAERRFRAVRWPVAFVHYFWEIRKVDKSIRLTRLCSLTEMHVHQWVWHKIHWGDVYLPRKP
jgi:hypothetical protein